MNYEKDEDFIYLFWWETSLQKNEHAYDRSHFDLNFFAKMDCDYLTTFMMLVTLSVIFIVNDDSFARKEFVF